MWKQACQKYACKFSFLSILKCLSLFLVSNLALVISFAIKGGTNRVAKGPFWKLLSDQNGLNIRLFWPSWMCEKVTSIEAESKHVIFKHEILKFICFKNLTRIFLLLLDKLGFYFFLVLATLYEKPPLNYIDIKKCISQIFYLIKF
jgi:hypothetical protein